MDLYILQLLGNEIIGYYFIRKNKIFNEISHFSVIMNVFAVIRYRIQLKLQRAHHHVREIQLNIVAIQVVVDGIQVFILKVNN